MAEIAVFAIGSELLEGSIIDTNSAWLGSMLVKSGANVNRVQLLPDNKELMMEFLEGCIGRYDVVLTTGGLGPTFDDITAEIIAEATKKEFTFNKQVWDSICARLKSRGITPKESHNRQACLPKDCMLFENKRGTAPGFAVESGGTLFMSMPGIPYEMKLMFEEQMLPYIRGRYNLKERYSIDIRIAGMPESDADDIITEIGIPDGVECIINVGKGELFIKLRSFDKVIAEEFAKAVVKASGNKFIGYGGDSLPVVVLRKLREKGLTLSVAESCTGGLIGGALTSVSGSSDIFFGGIISYSNEMKMNVLNVPEKVLIDHGAVSKECVSAMLDGACKVSGSDCSIAVSGVAGPDGGTKEKPVGTVVIGVKAGSRKSVKIYDFVGGREDIRERAVKTSFRDMLDIFEV